MEDREATLVRNSDGAEAVAAELRGLRRQLNILLFEVGTPVGRLFNLTMLLLIVAAVIVSMLDTLPRLHARWGAQFGRFEHQVLVLFAVEYVLRVYAARWRWRYVKSFSGIVDLLTVLPLFLTGQSYAVVRLLRLARIIRVAIFVPVVRALFASLAGSTRFLLGIMGTVILISVFAGNIAHILEPSTFTNAFEGAWWALVTMSTVGYGDYVPDSAAGQIIAAGLILSGICIFAMATAVISVRVGRVVISNRRCASCAEAISQDFLYCPHCGEEQPWRRDHLLEPDEV